MTTTRARNLVLGGLVTAVAFLLVGSDALGAPSTVTAKLKRGRLSVTGTGADDQVAVRLRAGDPLIIEVDVRDDGVADFAFSRSLFSTIDLSLGGGNDVARIDGTSGVFTDTEVTTLDGGSGDDLLLGGHGPETLVGGAGTDTADAGIGADTVDLGTGEDVFVWDPGDGSDLIEGGDGVDRLVFNGSGASEVIDLVASGNRLLVQRDVAAITLDTGGIEQIDLRTLGGTDRVTVHDLTGTEATRISVDLAGPADPNSGDAQPDQVIVEGTDGDDTITVAGSIDSGGVARVTGLVADVEIFHPEPAADRLDVNTLGGDDAIVNGLPPNVIKLYVDGTIQ